MVAVPGAAIAARFWVAACRRGVVAVVESWKGRAMTAREESVVVVVC